MFDQSDPRSSLAGFKEGGSRADGAHDAAEYVRFHEEPATVDQPDGRLWFARGKNILVIYGEVGEGFTWTRDAQPDEYAILLPDAGSQAEISYGAETVALRGNSLAFVPPGGSTLRVGKGGRITFLLTTAASDLVARCANNAHFLDGHDRVAPVQAWPAPDGGWRVRSYSLDVPPEPGRFGRIWRCTTIMINFLDAFEGPRDPRKLSPHHHDDFEQCSLALSGEFVHHLRWPWGIDKTTWRADEHVICGTPSIAVIPPPAIHTTEACGSGHNQLVDIFCPPRLDFSEKPGWILNASEYPMP